MGDDIAADIAAVSQIDAVPKILEVVCRTTGMGFAAVARVTDERWIACAVRDEIGFGLKAGGELELATTICNEIRQSLEPVVIDHVAEDAEFCGHPTPKQYGFQSYISTPIIYDGRFFGTLCAIDPKPAHLRNSPILPTFQLFADLIGAHLTARERFAASQAELLTAVETAELRDQFIAILGHDLRNPLAALTGGLRAIEKKPEAKTSALVVPMMRQSIDRMARLIDDVMDFARGRLGSGLEISSRPHTSLGDALQDVIDEFRLAQPDRDINAEFVIEDEVHCDVGRIAQLLSNLVGNALAHGASGQPISVGGHTRGGEFVLWVENGGAPIPPHIQSLLFGPFYRGRAGGQGLGLGLYIASQIAQAHGGDIGLVSDEDRTRFTFAMPISAPIPA